jgi:hypothetical protein
MTWPKSTEPRLVRNGLLKALALQKVTRHTATPLGVLRNHLVLRRASIHSASSRAVALGSDRTIRSDLVSHYAVHWECQRKWKIRQTSPTCSLSGCPSDSTTYAATCRIATMFDAGNSSWLSFNGTSQARSVVITSALSLALGSINEKRPRG